MELLPRRGALALRLRLQWRPGGVEPEVAGAAAFGAGLVARQPRSSVRKGRAGVFTDFWTARDAYIAVVLARGEVASGHCDLPAANADPFLEAQAGRPLDQTERTTALKLMELQRHAMFMYTSCGWFFDDISGIETVQIIAYAGRAVQLAAESSGRTLRGSKMDLSNGCAPPKATTRRRLTEVRFIFARSKTNRWDWKRSPPITPSVRSLPAIRRRCGSSAIW